MKNYLFPSLTEDEIKNGIQQANGSERRRHHKILHKQGAEFNEVFNFMMADSYMQPHLHPGNEKIEKIYIVEGKLAVFFFDNTGNIIKCTILEKGAIEMIEVPAFTWHTYAMLTQHAITYETMMGIYDPQTWKNYFTIAPPENSNESINYLIELKKHARSFINY